MAAVSLVIRASEPPPPPGLIGLKRPRTRFTVKPLNFVVFSTLVTSSFSTEFETLYPSKTHYNMKDAWTLEVILEINHKKTLTPITVDHGITKEMKVFLISFYDKYPCTYSQAWFARSDSYSNSKKLLMRINISMS